FVRYLNNIPYPFDLLVSTDTEDKAIILKKTLNKIDNLDTLNIKVLPNRGRDIAPMIIGFAKEMLEYDFALHLHSKKSPYS
ncbi:MAG: rhamnan synthesis F family protein, partial [Pseudomonadales bacterium]